MFETLDKAPISKCPKCGTLVKEIHAINTRSLKPFIVGVTVFVDADAKLQNIVHYDLTERVGPRIEAQVAVHDCDKHLHKHIPSEQSKLNVKD